MSICNFAVYAAVAGATNLAGLVLDRYRDSVKLVDGMSVYPAEAYDALFLWLAGLAVFATVLTFLVPETRGQPTWRKDEAGAGTGAAETAEEHLGEAV
jgi:hypothetical protein